MKFQLNLAYDKACENMNADMNATSDRDGVTIDVPRRASAGLEGDPDLEPRNGIEFDSHEAAYAFYQEYAKSMGFTTSIKNSRRSKKSKEFIDAKFACSRYGVTPESDGCSSRRTSVKKTDCRASMHVKRRADGKWIIHEFVKEHNHELLPALAYHFRIQRNVRLAEKNNIDILNAVSERTRKMYVEMSRQSGGFQNLGFLQTNTSNQFRGRHLVLDEGEAQTMLEYFKHIKKENPKFFYAIDLNEEQRLRNMFWVDAKSREDYICFSDVVSFDTTYVKFNDKLPLAPFIGVNHHCQPLLLGCALIADESNQTFVWLMRTWLRAMRGQAPKVMLTNQDKALSAAIEEVFPNTRHCFALWHILEKIPESLGHVIKRHENFLPEFSKCIYKPWTDDQFELEWWSMVTRFELQDDDWVKSLYEHRKMWMPTFMEDVFLAGMSAPQRSESMNSFFDKYIHKKITLKEFVRLYGSILQNNYEEEAVADFDTSHKQPALKSPSPWEKQMSTIYTHAIFKKFQFEVLGVVACHPQKESEDEETVTFRVQDCEKGEEFMVTWNENKSELTCCCRLFEYKGFLCRHAMMVLQICGFTSIPPRYILKRWTKDAKSRQMVIEGTEQVQTRVQRYNDLCQRAIELSKEGSLTEGTYSIVLRMLIETLKNCVDVNNSKGNILESNSHSHGLCQEEDQVTGAAKSNKKKATIKKRKGQPEPHTLLLEAQDNLQHMENLASEGMGLNSYYGAQQNVQGLLNLMEPPHDGYYVNQRGIQNLGQLNPIAPGHESFFGHQQGIPGLGQLDFRPPSSYPYNLQDDSHLRSAQLHGTSSRQL